MQLTRYTDYSLRVLIFASLKDKDQRITISDIAEHFQISRNHLLKVVHHLSKLGLLHTTRGKGGGIELGRPIEQINIGEVVRQMESNLDIIDCNEPPCPIQPACRLKGILQEASQAFLNVLDQYTLADLLQSPEQLKPLLRMQISG
jgi:Rrf2 family nitric oxide-sensitive transcriptional repressor